MARYVSESISFTEPCLAFLRDSDKLNNLDDSVLTSSQDFLTDECTDSQHDP